MLYELATAVRIARPEESIAGGWYVHEEFAGFDMHSGAEEKEVDVIGWCVCHESATQGVDVEVAPN
jgi:hypothetical protein